jgi:hypothetical protein
MGDTEEEDTWKGIEKFCSGTTQATGTGWGYYKFLNNRLWVAPESPIQVAIYERSNKQKFRQWREIGGLLSFMMAQKKYGIVKMEVNGIDIKAHWAILAQGKEPKIRPNVAGTGHTAVTYKGEVYRDINLSPKTTLKHLKDSGIIYNSGRVMIVFEVAADTAGVKTNLQRTKLIYGGAEIDEDELRALFRTQLPPEIKEWLKDQVEGAEHQDAEDWLKNMVKKFDYSQSSAPSNKKGLGAQGKKQSDNVINFPNHPPQTPPSAAHAYRKHKAERDAKKLPLPGQLGPRRLKAGLTPKPIRISDIGEPLVEFHLEEYKIVVNDKHDLFTLRAKRIKESCSSLSIPSKMIGEWVYRYVAWSAVYRIFEVYKSYGRSSTSAELKEKWAPDILEAAWGPQMNEALIKKMREESKKMSRAALING